MPNDQKSFLIINGFDQHANNETKSPTVRLEKALKDAGHIVHVIGDGKTSFGILQLQKTIKELSKTDGKVQIIFNTHGASEFYSPELASAFANQYDASVEKRNQLYKQAAPLQIQVRNMSKVLKMIQNSKSHTVRTVIKKRLHYFQNKYSVIQKQIGELDRKFRFFPKTDVTGNQNITLGQSANQCYPFEAIYFCLQKHKIDFNMAVLTCGGGNIPYYFDRFKTGHTVFAIGEQHELVTSRVIKQFLQTIPDAQEFYQNNYQVIDMIFDYLVTDFGYFKTAPYRSLPTLYHNRKIIQVKNSLTYGRVFTNKEKALIHTRLDHLSTKDIIDGMVTKLEKLSCSSHKQVEQTLSANEYGIALAIGLSLNKNLR